MKFRLPLIEPKDQTRLQRIVGSLLFYACAIDNTLLHGLREIASQQAKLTEKTRRACWHLLDYCVTQLNTTLRFRKSSMVLWVISDAAYLVAPEARSRAGGHFFLEKKYETNAP